MKTALWIVLALLVNTAVGAGVWAAADDDRRSYFRWYDSAPGGPLAPLLQFVVLQAWPAAVWAWWRRPGAEE